MNIQALSLFHLKIPCKNTFSHAMSSRDHSEVVLIKLISDKNTMGWGEVVPRLYVTGECIQSVMGSDNALDSMGVIGRKIDSVGALQEWIDPLLDQGRENLALLGGVELAMWGLLGQQGKSDLDSTIGLPRQSPAGVCFTIGFDCMPEQLRGFFIAARMKKATTIKLKVGNDMDRDIECVKLLQKYSNGGIQIRLDGNGVLTLEAASQLLSAVCCTDLHSFEEPLDRNGTDVVDQLAEIHSRFNVDLMADESVCSQSDADNIIKDKSYQWFNIRVGKHGGMLASCRIRDKAAAAGMGVVAGSMVGETSALTQASTLFLNRSSELDYVEGLGQNRSWLRMDPFKPSVSQSMDFHDLCIDQAVLEQCLVEQKHIT